MKKKKEKLIQRMKEYEVKSEEIQQKYLESLEERAVKRQKYYEKCQKNKEIQLQKSTKTREEIIERENEILSKGYKKDQMF